MTEHNENTVEEPDVTSQNDQLKDDVPVTTLQKPQNDTLQAKASACIRKLQTELQQALIGQESTIEYVLIALLSGGHVLLEGAPGLGKTLLTKALAQCIGGHFKRIQFTPDLMPCDITGQTIYDTKTEQFKLYKGPVFTHLLLADEINRAPARTQSALLEAMQEQQVTLEGKALPLPQPFMVLATQNPLEQEGTYPLPESQLDRFMFKLNMDYLNQEQELAMVQRIAKLPPSSTINLTTIIQPHNVLALQKITASITIDDQLVDYIVCLVRATRDHSDFIIGAGPKASILLIRAAQACALMNNRSFVLPEDIKHCFLPILRHRVRLTAEQEIAGKSTDTLLSQLLEEIPSPRL